MRDVGFLVANLVINRLINIFNLKGELRLCHQQLTLTWASYVKSHFDTTGHFTSDFLNDNPSTISRLSNLMVSAIGTTYGSKILPLPKLVICVPDDDLIQILHTLLQ